MLTVEVDHRTAQAYERMGLVVRKSRAIPAETISQKGERTGFRVVEALLLCR
jgi:hypothetical protein